MVSAIATIFIASGPVRPVQGADRPMRCRRVATKTAAALASRQAVPEQGTHEQPRHRPPGPPALFDERARVPGQQAELVAGLQRGRAERAFLGAVVFAAEDLEGAIR